MSIRELLDDGLATPAAWKKLAVSRIRSVSSLTEGSTVDGDLVVTGDTTLEQVFVNNIRYGINDAEHSLSFYRSLTNEAVDLGANINANAATNKVYYEKVGRLVTLSFVSSRIDGIFDVTGAPAALPFTALGADIAAQLLIDFNHVPGTPASDDFVFPLNGSVVLVGLLINRGANHPEFEFRKIAPNAALAAGNNFANFTISFVAATAE